MRRMSIVYELDSTHTPRGRCWSLESKQTTLSRASYQTEGGVWRWEVGRLTAMTSKVIEGHLEVQGQISRNLKGLFSGTGI